MGLWTELYSTPTLAIKQVHISVDYVLFNLCARIPVQFLFTLFFGFQENIGQSFVNVLMAHLHRVTIL